ncbi:hypothetical protein IW262DRAFT_1297778 [Armillaria fumosa]|nr:hypothetical protein IW262DRAFT_1297778 [Armillaria fumosa]
MTGTFRAPQATIPYFNSRQPRHDDHAALPICLLVSGHLVLGSSTSQIRRHFIDNRRTAHPWKTHLPNSDTRAKGTGKHSSIVVDLKCALGSTGRLVRNLEIITFFAVTRSDVCKRGISFKLKSLQTHSISGLYPVTTGNAVGMNSEVGEYCEMPVWEVSECREMWEIPRQGLSVGALESQGLFWYSRVPVSAEAAVRDEKVASAEDADGTVCLYLRARTSKHLEVNLWNVYLVALDDIVDKNGDGESREP